MAQRPARDGARAIARQAERPAMWPWVVLALALSVVAAQAQNQTAEPPAARDAPAPGTPGLSAQGSGPQTATPPPGANAGKGVITPPGVDPGIGTGTASRNSFPMPVIKPSDATPSGGTVVPK